MSSATVRIDRWLVAARCFKTRALAHAACDGGHVKLVLDDAPRVVGPDRPVRPGNIVEVLTPDGKRILAVKELGVRRGTAEAARALYTDLTPPAPPSPEPTASREAGAGRPTKRDRRLIEALQGGEFD